MPLLQHALLELWKRRHGRVLKAEEYQAIGRVAGRDRQDGGGGLRRARRRPRPDPRHLPPPDPRWTSRHDRARLRPRHPAAGCGSSAWSRPGRTWARPRRLVKHLADRRLIVTTSGGRRPADRGRGGPRGADPSLAPPDRVDRREPARLRLRQGVIEASEEWSQSGRDRALLVHQGERLAEAERLRDDPRLGLSDPDRSYVDACSQQRRRRQVTAGVLAAVVAGCC